MNETRRAYLELHIAVFLWGFTAILGHKIQLTAIILVWWRVFVTCAVIALTSKTIQRVRHLPRKLVWQYAGIGCIVVLHWICFYGAIKLANASVALICLATTSFQSAIFEPLFNRRPVKKYEVALGFIIVPAMFFVAGDLPKEMNLGFWVGILSAVLVVIFSVLNKRLVEKADPLSITFLELGGGGVFLTLFLPIFLYLDPQAQFIPRQEDWLNILFLAVLCTNLAYWLGVRALRQLSAFTTNLTVNLEPVYGITLAWLLLGENKTLSLNFYVGAALIIVAVLSYPLLKSKFEKEAKT